MTSERSLDLSETWIELFLNSREHYLEGHDSSADGPLPALDPDYVHPDIPPLGLLRRSRTGTHHRTLEDNIRDRGAPTRVLSDRGSVNISEKCFDILRALFVPQWQSEPRQQHQNPAERRIQTVKHMANVILDRTGAPDYTWLLCVTHFEPNLLGYFHPGRLRSGNKEKTTLITD